MAITKPNIKVTDEPTRNELKQSSAFALPNNPSARGMSADAIKQAFWAPILSQNASLLKELDRVVGEVNTYLDTVYAHIGRGEIAAIDEAYKEFVSSEESGLTQLSNTAWRVLMDLIDKFNKQAPVIAEQIAVAKGHAEDANASAGAAHTSETNAAKSASEAEASATAAAASATASAELAEYTRNRANEANASANTAKNSAAAANEWFIRTEEAAAEAQKGMKLSKELICYAYVGTDGSARFEPYSGYKSTIEDGTNAVWIASWEEGKNESLSAIKMLIEIFSCKMVEIIINDGSESQITEKILYQERSGGSKTFSTTGFLGGEDLNGTGYTRLVYFKTFENGEVIKYRYSLKLSSSLANCIRTAVAFTHEDGVPVYPKLPIYFKGYN